jgi:hypothetical protein
MSSWASRTPAQARAISRRLDVAWLVAATGFGSHGVDRLRAHRQKGLARANSARPRVSTIWIVRATQRHDRVRPEPALRTNALAAGGHRPRYIRSAAILGVVASSLLSATRGVSSTKVLRPTARRLQARVSLRGRRSAALSTQPSFHRRGRQEGYLLGDDVKRIVLVLTGAPFNDGGAIVPRRPGRSRKRFVCASRRPGRTSSLFGRTSSLFGRDHAEDERRIEAAAS